MRPDGIEVENLRLTTDQLGAHHQSFLLPRDARIGAWRAELRVDPKAPPVGVAEFQVEDFVPPQLEVKLAAADGPIQPAKAFPVDVAAHYYYGAPGSGLAIEAEALIAVDDDPFPTHPGFQFGLVGEEFTGDRREVEAPSTDDQGKAKLAVVLSDLPELTRPLAATIRVGVFEPSGRAVTETLTRPIRQRPLWLGLRSPNGEEAVAEGSEAKVEVIAVDPQGGRSPPRGCASSCCARAGNTAGIRSKACGGTRSRCATGRSRPARSMSAPICRRPWRDRCRPGVTVGR